MNQPKQKKKRNIWVRLGRIVLKTILFLFLFFILIVLLILTPPVQNFLRKKAVVYLEKKLDTHVAIGRIYIGLPKKVVLEDIYIEDRQKDTLLSGGLVKVDISLSKLIFHQEVDIQSIQLENITAKIKRQLPDTTFNYQFIIDAFSPKKDPNSPPDTSSSSSIAIHSISLDKSRLVYKDVVTGNDVEAWIDHFDTKIDKIDPDKMRIDIPRITLNGLTARVYQSKPLFTPSPSASAATPAVAGVYPQLNFDKVDLQKISLDYRNEVSALYTVANIGSLLVEMKKLDMAEQIIDFNTISLENTTAAVRIGRKQAAKEMLQTVKEKTDSSLKKGWRLQLASLNSSNNHIKFDNDNLPRQKTGMDYAHINAEPLELQVKDFLLSDDTLSGTIEKASFKEQSGFELQELQTAFFYSDKESFLHDLYVKTPGTELKRSATLQYYSPDVFQKDIGNLRLDIDLDNSKLLVKDLLTFAPMLRSQPAFADPNTTWFVNSRIQGRVADLNIEALQIRGLQNTRIDIKGKITGLPDINKFSADLAIRNISTSRHDINLFVPAAMMPKDITLPNSFSMTGNVKGNTHDLNTSVNVKTDLGSLAMKGNIKQLNDKQNAKYDATLSTSSLDLGTILQDKQTWGPITSVLAINGRGLDPKTADIFFDGKILSAVLKQYNYHNLDVKGKLIDKQATVRAFIMDPNLHIAVDATADISNQYPAVHLSAMIDSIKTQALHLTPDLMIFRGKIDADFTSTNPDDLNGKLFLTQALLVQNSQRFELDTVQLIASRSDSGHYIQLTSDIVTARLEGQYKLTQLGVILQQAIQPYFAINTSRSVVTAAPYDFTLNASVVNGAPLKTFLPDLKKMDSLKIQSHFSNTSGWNASITAPSIDYGTNQIRGLELKAGTGAGKDSIAVNAVMKQFVTGTMGFYNSTVKASLANNKINFTFDTRDKADKSRYNFTALFEQPQPGQYSFSFAPEGLLLNYERWTVPADNRILISSNNITASNFVLSKSGQQLSLNSLTQTANSPLEARFQNFRLSTITAFIQNDSTLIDGRLNGAVTFNDIIRDPIFKGELNINDLSVKGDTVGNVVMHVNNTAEDVYNADIVLSGRGNDVRINGKYYMAGSGNSTLDMDMNIVNLPLASVQALSGGEIRSASGSVNGRFTVKGTLDNPSVRGDLNFAKAGFNFRQLNSYFHIDNEKIEINERGVQFNRFEIKDSTGNTLVLDGTAETSNYKNYQFNFTIRANNFQALNSTKQDNNLFYGQLFFNSNLRVHGTEATPIVDGSITVNEKTKMTIVLPQREPGIVQREGVVEFVDMDAPLNDSLFLQAYDTLNKTSLFGLDVTANIEVKKEAQFNLIIDEGNGDFLNVQGEALLSAGIDPSGKLTLAGSYELEQGSYELTFNMIKRKFQIEKGSKLTWLGEPTDADVNITALYTANTAPLDLVKNELGSDISPAQRNTYLQKIPFDVTLIMQGKLLKPQISFDIKLPENKSYNVSNDILTNVRTKLELLRQDPGELDKQVFALLLLNRFIGENPFNSSAQGLTANTLARQSVSKLLTEQLNKLAESLIEGVDLNFDVLSTDDYTSGERRDRTDLNVGLSKQLLNDRLSVSVGSNFELEGPQNSTQKTNNIAGNVAINYQLSRDGRYALKAYRKNEYEGVIDGYVIETGVSFIITVDYNKFSQIFLSQKERQKRRQMRRSNRQETKKDANEQMQTAKELEKGKQP